jgi:putative acetyltransferase
LKSKNPCPGANISQRCASKNCRFFVCATEKGLSFCHECTQYPCARFKRFATNWVKYGQNFFENQKELRAQGTEFFLARWNRAACEGESA